jgi:signal transduction histidine kinase
MDPETLYLLHGFAHDLRTPLSAIAGHSSLLSLGVHGPLSAAQAHALNRIEANKKELIGMIGKLLNYAEAASAALTPSLSACALYPMVAHGVNALKATALARGVRFVCADDKNTSASSDAHAADSRSDLAQINESTTQEIIGIMLADALAHSERGSEVAVRVQRTSDVLSVIVESSAREPVDYSHELLFVPYARDAHGRPVYAPGRSLSLPRARVLARGMGADVHAVFEQARRIVQLDVPHATTVCHTG